MGTARDIFSTGTTKGNPSRSKHQKNMEMDNGKCVHTRKQTMRLSIPT